MGNSAGGTAEGFYKMGQAQVGADPKGNKLEGLDKVTEALRSRKLARETENKAIQKEEKEARKLGGQKVSNAFEQMAPTLKALGPESFGKAQEEVEALRQEMFAAIDAKDQKKIAELNMKLNDIKTRHAGDAENLTTLVESWEDGTVSTDAMTKDQIRVMEQFATNKSKKVVYDEDNNMMYEWDTEEPLIDEVTGEQQVDKEGNPMFKKEKYSMTDMQDMLVTKETVNGVKMLDYGEELKQSFKDGAFPSDDQLKAKVSEIIPQDATALRDWLHGNPAEQNGLDVHGYLTDLMSVSGDFNTFSAMGVDTSQFDDTNGIEGIQADEIPDEFKEELIRKVMDVDDVEMSHKIISDVYASLLKNNGMGVENKEYRSQSETSILGSKTDATPAAKLKRKETLTVLQSLGDPKSPIHAQLAGLSDEGIARHLGFENLQSQIYNDVSGQMESIETYIASGVKKKGKSSTDKTDTSNMTEKELQEYYK